MSYQQEVFSFISSIVGQNNIIAIPVEFVRFVGDFNTAAILTQLIYWQGKGRDPDGWIYKSYPDWEKETALNKKRATRAVNNLKKMGLIETKVAKVEGNPTLHYKFNNEVFVDLFGRHLEAERAKEELKAPKTVVSDQRVLTKIPKGHFPKLPKGINLPYTETTIKDYDDIPNSPAPPPTDPTPEAEDAIPSSSFSQHDLNNLMQALPQERRSSQVEQRLTKALIAGFTMAYLLDCIAYSHDKNPKNFLSYLGNCIDKDYAPEGYHKDKEEILKKQAKAKAKKEKERLKAIQKQQAIQSQQMNIKQKHATLEKLLKDEPLRYFELVQQAGENLGIDPNKPGTGGKMSIKFEIMRILEL